MRVLILTQHYDPEPIPKPAELARALRARGHDVHVLAGLPNYPAGELYPGYRLRPLTRETVDGVPVVRTFVFPYHGRSSLLRIFNYLSFMCSAVLGAWCTPACDVIYVLHPPLTIGVPAWILSVLKRAPFVYDVQDIWPESLPETGMMSSPRLLGFIGRVARWIYRRAAVVLAITEEGRTRLIANGAPADRVVVPALWVTDKLFRPADGAARVREQFGLEGRFVVMFAGNLGVVQKLDTLIDAAARLHSHPEILIVLVGDGMDRDRLEQRARAQQLTNVRFLGRQPFAAMPDFQAAADVLLVHLKRTPITDFLVPAKVLMYLATGRPTIVAMEGPASELVQRAQAGLAIPAEDPAALAAAITQLAAMTPAEREQTGSNGRAYLLRQNSPEHVVDQYEQLLLGAMKRARPA